MSDVHVFNGGLVVWIQDDGTAAIQVAGRPPPTYGGHSEKRYLFRVKPEEWAEVERLVGAHDLLHFKENDSPREPDQAKLAITLLTKSGKKVTAAKLDGDTHPDFDPVYEYLVKLSNQADRTKPVYEGKFDWNWRPAGFEPVR